MEKKNKEIVYYEKLEKKDSNKTKDFALPNVIGLKEQKKELINVVKWFENGAELRKKGVSIPRGCILFGHPGNGKSLLMKEIIKLVDCPVFILKGDDDNIVKGITEIFKKARESGRAVIIIDELDLLINKDKRVIRALQENLDGVESNDDLLVLAATNDMDEIPDPLLRSGRLEKIIHISYPNSEEAVELLKLYFKNFGVQFSEEIDEFEVGLALNRVSCASIKSIVNDVVLHNGFENITEEMIDDSIADITDRIKRSEGEKSFNVAVHEASHAVMASKFKEYFFVNRLKLHSDSGEFTAKEVKDNVWPFEKCVADIQIGMAGTIGEKIICKEQLRGCERDLENARITAYNLINKNGYSSCWETLPNVREGARTETQIKRRRMERKIEKLLRKCEKDTYKYISKHQDEIVKLANLLLKKNHLRSKDILECIGK